MTLKNIVISDAGTYYCQAKNLRWDLTYESNRVDVELIVSSKLPVVIQYTIICTYCQRIVYDSKMLTIRFGEVMNAQHI